MARQSFKGDKRRRQLDKQRKQEEKRKKRLNKDPNAGEADTSYLEYLSPGGPMDPSFVEPEEETDSEEEDETDN
jgi:hypothetical protein